MSVCNLILASDSVYFSAVLVTERRIRHYRLHTKTMRLMKTQAVYLPSKELILMLLKRAKKEKMKKINKCSPGFD